MSSPLLRLAGDTLRHASPKQVAISGPAGFLGSRVVDNILDVHEHRQAAGHEPGELLLLSSSPGHLMERLTRKYGAERMKTVRASRVDYYHQHQIDVWHDQLGSLGLGGEHAVFVNLAAIAGPVTGRPDAMMHVNYKAPMAAATACEALGFGHWVQSSTQATKAERAGQVPYSRWKAMADFSLSRLQKLPVSVCVLGLLYCRDSGVVGQRGEGLNMVDLSLLPLTPIMGSGLAPLQPLDVSDAAQRLAFLALSEPASRPLQAEYDQPTATSTSTLVASSTAAAAASSSASSGPRMRTYDAVGPETMTMLDMLKFFARLNGNTLRPVFVDYRNFEKVLNVASLGNLNRQFVSILRSEQDADRPITGNPTTFARLLSETATLATLDEAFALQLSEGATQTQRRAFPYLFMARWVWENKGVVVPGAALVIETLGTAAMGDRWRNAAGLQESIKVVGTVGSVFAVAGLSVHFGSQLAISLIAASSGS